MCCDIPELTCAFLLFWFVQKAAPHQYRIDTALTQLGTLLTHDARCAELLREQFLYKSRFHLKCLECGTLAPSDKGGVFTLDDTSLVYELVTPTYGDDSEPCDLSLTDLFNIDKIGTSTARMPLHCETCGCETDATGIRCFDVLPPYFFVWVPLNTSTSARVHYETTVKFSSSEDDDEGDGGVMGVYKLMAAVSYQDDGTDHTTYIARRQVRNGYWRCGDNQYVQPLDEATMLQEMEGRGCLLLMQRFEA